MKKTLSREIENLKFELKDHFLQYKKWYIFFSILVGLGLSIGLFVGFSMKTNLTLDKIPETLFVNFVEGKTGLISLVFLRIINMLLLLFGIWLSCFRPWLGLLGSIIIVYRSFVLGVTIASLIILYNVVGMLNIFLLVLPCYILFLFILASFATICISFSFASRSYGGSVLSINFLCRNKKALLVLLCLMLICVVLELILLPILSSTLLIPSA